MKPIETAPMPLAAAASSLENPKMIEVENLDFYYGHARALQNINLQITGEQGHCLHRPVPAAENPPSCGASTA